MEIRATMSGTVWKLLVRPGDLVETGQEVAVLESMKMEIPILAESGGTVEEVRKKEGEFVQEQEVLITLQEK